MKRTHFTAVIMCMAVLGTAQIIETPKTPQTPGGSGEETQASKAFKPLAGDVTLEFNFNPFAASPLSFNYLRARYFVEEQLALRTGLMLGIQGGSSFFSLDWGIFPGVEGHFKGTERLSPYIGGELAIAGRASSGTDIKGAWPGGSNRGFFNFGINGVAGCDFYFSKRIYMGLEGGFGLSLISNSDIVDTVSGATTSKGGTTFQLGPNYNSAIRLGFVF
jgi:hypothetical protein